MAHAGLAGPVLPCKNAFHEDFQGPGLAGPVLPERLGVPALAATCDPRNHLKGKKLEVFNNLEAKKEVWSVGQGGLKAQEHDPVIGVVTSGTWVSGHGSLSILHPSRSFCDSSLTLFWNCSICFENMS